MRFHWSHLSAVVMFLGFAVVMSYVMYSAYARRSGSTGLDVAQIQKIRFEATKTIAESESSL